MMKIVFLMLLLSACDSVIPITDELDGKELLISEKEALALLQKKDLILFKGYYFVKASVAISSKIPLAEGQKRAEEHCRQKAAEAESMKITATKTLTENTKELSGTREMNLKKQIQAVSTTQISEFRVLKTIREEIRGGLRITVYAIMKRDRKS